MVDEKTSESKLESVKFLYTNGFSEANCVFTCILQIPATRCKANYLDMLIAHLERWKGFCNMNTVRDGDVLTRVNLCFVPQSAGTRTLTSAPPSPASWSSCRPSRRRWWPPCLRTPSTACRTTGGWRSRRCSMNSGPKRRYSLTGRHRLFLPRSVPDICRCWEMKQSNCNHSWPIWTPKSPDRLPSFNKLVGFLSDWGITAVVLERTSPWLRA